MKKNVLFNLIMILNSTIHGQSGNWEVYLSKLEKGIGSTIVDLSFHETAPLKSYRFILITGVTVTECGKDGIPADSTFSQLYDLSDKMGFLMDLHGKNMVVGSFTYQCKRLDYYYLADTANVRHKIDSVYKNDYPELKPYTSIEKDEKWNTYFSFLYPDDGTLEHLLNEKVIVKLMEGGDKLTVPRQVDHWLYFRTPEDREKFIEFALEKKFTIGEKRFLASSNTPYQLRISRIDNVDIRSMCAITIDLRKKAATLNGRYDGWETHIIK
jgi:hypothetical protein